MRIPPCIADLTPPRVGSKPVAPGVRAGVPVRARALASTLLGALAGLAAGAVIAAAAPGVGRTASMQDLPAAARADGTGLRGGAAASPVSAVSAVSAVLAPAIEVGVVPALDPETARP